MDKVLGFVVALAPINFKNDPAIGASSAVSPSISAQVSASFMVSMAANSASVGPAAPAIDCDPQSTRKCDLLGLLLRCAGQKPNSAGEEYEEGDNVEMTPPSSKDAPTVVVGVQLTIDIHPPFTTLEELAGFC